MDTLAFGYILPTTGWILDLHQLETCAAERTKIKPAAKPPVSEFPFKFRVWIKYFDS
jgi:hypothetical protein